MAKNVLLKQVNMNYFSIDLASGNVTMETVEKRVRLDVETVRAVIDFSNSCWPDKQMR